MSKLFQKTDDGVIINKRKFRVLHALVSIVGFVLMFNDLIIPKLIGLFIITIVNVILWFAIWHNIKI